VSNRVGTDAHAVSAFHEIRPAYELPAYRWIGPGAERCAAAYSRTYPGEVGYFVKSILNRLGSIFLVESRL
jgi:hypothetical protein